MFLFWSNLNLTWKGNVCFFFICAIYRFEHRTALYMWTCSFVVCVGAFYVLVFFFNGCMFHLKVCRFCSILKCLYERAILCFYGWNCIIKICFNKPVVRLQLICPLVKAHKMNWVYHTDKKCIAWMQCKSLWIKASAKCTNGATYKMCSRETPRSLLKNTVWICIAYYSYCFHIFKWQKY